MIVVDHPAGRASAWPARVAAPKILAQATNLIFAGVVEQATARPG